MNNRLSRLTRGPLPEFTTSANAGAFEVPLGAQPAPDDDEDDLDMEHLLRRAVRESRRLTSRSR